MRNAVCLSALAFFSFLPLAAASQAAKPVRHLVYTFTWGASTDLEMHTSGFAEDQQNAPTMGAASGMSESTGGTQDKGTITVDVLREQPDRGLVVVVSEQAQGARSAPPTTCVVFGNTNVICDSSGKVNEEELSLVRLLGPTFIDATQLDAKQHWREQENAPDSNTTSDFTVVSNAGGQLKISETRTVAGTGSRPYTRDITSTIGYDPKREIPTSVSEDSTERSEGTNQYQTVKSQTSLQLEADSLAAKP